jgi:hypothetical protein
LENDYVEALIVAAPVAVVSLVVYVPLPAASAVSGLAVRPYDDSDYQSGLHGVSELLKQLRIPV